MPLPKTYAMIENTQTKETRKKKSNHLPIIMCWFRSALSQNSVSFINTTRNGSFNDANVSALVWDLNTKKNTLTLLEI
jgi:hypothetical protein